MGLLRLLGQSGLFLNFSALELPTPSHPKSLSCRQEKADDTLVVDACGSKLLVLR